MSETMTAVELDKSLVTVLNEMDKVEYRLKSPRRIRVDVGPDALPGLLGLLKGKASYVHLSAITCVDWIKDNEFELVYHLWSYVANGLVSAHTRISRDSARYVSVYDMFKPASFFERDIFEMFGIYFEGSPRMEKFILTEWNGPPPMRKDFDAEAYVQETFNWQDYRPDWLKDLEEAGGGVEIRPEDVRK
jgi:NADH-quinone oxidoreductase subunit C